MDEDLRAWSNTWQSMEVDMNLLQRSQSAHRREATIRTGQLCAIVAAALLLTVRVALALTGHGAAPPWPAMGFASGAVLVGFAAWLYVGRQIAQATTALRNTPGGLVADLMRLHERELEQWSGGASLTITALLASGTIAIAVSHLVEVAGAGQPTSGAWGVLVATLLSLAGVVFVGHRRVTQLRRELSALRDLQSQLA